MRELEVILGAFSFGDASEKLYGYCNSKTIKKIKGLLTEKGYQVEGFYKDKNRSLKYKNIEKVCPIFKFLFLTKEKHRTERKTCSIACSNSLTPKRKKDLLYERYPNGKIKKKYIREHNRKDERKEKIKGPKIEIIKNKKFECITCNKIFSKQTRRSKILACSDECRKKYYRRLMQQKVNSGEHKGWIIRNIISYPETYFMEVLDNLNIQYKFNYAIAQSELGYYEKGSYYALDFFIEKNSIKIDLEIDGKQHEFTKRKESDKIRDKILSNNDYLVYRIKWKGLSSKSAKEYTKKEIEKFKNWYYNL